MKITKLADGLGWPEGPSQLPDGRIIFVETYRSQVSVWEEGRGVSRNSYIDEAIARQIVDSEKPCVYRRRRATPVPHRMAQRGKSRSIEVKESRL